MPALLRGADRRKSMIRLQESCQITGAVPPANTLTFLARRSRLASDQPPSSATAIAAGASVVGDVIGMLRGPDNPPRISLSLSKGFSANSGSKVGRIAPCIGPMDSEGCTLRTNVARG